MTIRGSGQPRQDERPGHPQMAHRIAAAEDQPTGAAGYASAPIGEAQPPSVSVPPPGATASAAQRSGPGPAPRPGPGPGSATATAAASVTASAARVSTSPPGVERQQRGRPRPPRPTGTVSALDVANGRSHGRRLGALRALAFLAVAAVVVLVLLGTVLQPLVRGVIVGWAADNPSALRIGFVHDLVREDLGATLTAPNSSDPAKVDFTVVQGDTVVAIADRLHDQGLLRDPRALVLLALDQGVADGFRTGTFSLARNLTPAALISALLAPDTSIVINLRTGLRLEQITALLAAKPPDLATLQMDPKAFYDFVTHPPAELLKDYPWVVIPKGGSLEGYLAAGSYRVQPDVTPEQLVRMMLDKFAADVGMDRIHVPASRGLSWYQTLTLASIVEQEAQLNEERPVIAGVYQNRLDPSIWPLGLLQADPTVVYANDTMQLRQVPITAWAGFSFWELVGKPLATFAVPADLASYQTYQHAGLPAGPICTPTVASIDAVLNPDTKDRYLFFVAIPDGGGHHAFARTQAEFDQLLRKYGYTN